MATDLRRSPGRGAKGGERPPTQFSPSRSGMISYEDLLIAQYLEDLRKKRSEVQREREVSPYLQKMPHSQMMHVYTSGHTRRRRPHSASVVDRSHSAEKPKIDARFIADPTMWDPATPRKETIVATTGIKHQRPVSAPPKRPRSRPVSGISYCSYRQFSARPSSGKRTKSLYKRQPLAVRVMAFKNGTREGGVRCTAPNIKLLLEALTEKLNMPFAARRIFVEDGIEVFDGRDVPPYAEVYISMGENYKDPYLPYKREITLKNGARWTLTGVILPEEGKKKRTKSKLSKRMRGLLDKKKVRILVYRNGKATEPIEVVADPGNMEDFLIACTAKLDLRSHARIVYDWDGNVVSELTDTPILEDCLQQGGTPVLGPLWISTGEGFSPSGTYDFLQHLCQIMRSRLKSIKSYKKDIDLALDDKKDEVSILTIQSMTHDELYDAAEKADADIEHYQEALKRVKARLAPLEGKKQEEEDQGAKYRMTHIQELDAEDRLVGTKGLRLRVYPNGSLENELIFYFNLREAYKGVGNNPARVMQRLLDEVSMNAWTNSTSAPKLNAVAQKIFNEFGREIKNVNQLKPDQVIFLSYGESFITPYTYCVTTNFEKAARLYAEGEEKFAKESISQDDVAAQDGPDSWEISIGFPAMYEEKYQYDQGRVSEMLETAEVDGRSHYLIHKEVRNLVLYPEAAVSDKPKRGHNDNQIWVVTKGGHIACKRFQQLVLAVSDTRVEGRLFDREVPLEGFVVSLQKKMRANPNQTWRFNPDGTITSDAYPSLLLTYLGGHLGDEESYYNNKPQGTKSGVRVYLVVSDPLPKKEASAQRFALKQERFDILGQWKYTKSNNPEWSKQALSWPVDEEGQIVEDYDWPMEGFLLPNAPPFQIKGKKNQLSGMTPLRLQVLKNGERDAQRATTVVGPNLTNMMKETCKKEKDKTGKNKMPEPAPGPDSVEVDIQLHCRDLTVRELEFVMFLDHCTAMLNLPFAARRLFDERGQEHFTLQTLKRDQLVYVSCGEPWTDPRLTRTEQQRRLLLAQLSADVAKVRQYCALRNPAGLVLETEAGLTTGAKMVVNKCWTPGEQEAPQEPPPEIESASTMEALVSEPVDPLALTAHERAHLEADKRLETLKWPWERLADASRHSGETDEEAHKYTDREMYERYKPKATPRVSRDTLQRFTFVDGFIAVSAQPDLVLGVAETEGRISDVVLQRRHPDALTQRWIMKENGEIRSRYNQQMVLTVSMPRQLNQMGDDLRPLTFAGCSVTVQSRCSNQFGHAHQRWMYDADTGFIHAFNSDIPDKEITAANKADVCTYAVVKTAKIDQPGYAAEIPASTMTSVAERRRPMEITVCTSCARAMRGRYKLSKLPPNMPFYCAMGEAKRLRLPLVGSFRVLNNKVDLSTHEAEYTLEKWEEKLSTLREEMSLNTIAKEISAARSVRTVKIMAYKNGEGRLKPGEIICGSSIEGLLNQCTHRLSLSTAARRLYTEDGTIILDVDDLIDWAVEHYKINLADQLERFMLRQEEGENPVMDNAIRESQEQEEREEATLRAMQEEARGMISAQLARAMQFTQEDEDEETETERGDAGFDDGTGGDASMKEEEGKTGVDNTEAVKLRQRREELLQGVKLPPLDEILRYPIEVWVSATKQFVPPDVVESKEESRKKRRQFRAQVALELDMEKHILRQMKGRRLEEQRPGEYRSTLCSEQPVIKEGHWQDTPTEERMKTDAINKLQSHLGEININQREKPAPLVHVNLKGKLYDQPNMKRVLIYPNGESPERAVYVWGETLDQLMENATLKLGLWKAGRILFDKEGKLIEDFDEVGRDQLLCMSSGKPFQRRNSQHLDVEVRANWGRARKQYGPGATDVMVTASKNPKVNVDPFGPPQMAVKQE